nr:hypothetical protein ICEMyc226_00260 [Mycolicibacterium sp.]
MPSINTRYESPVDTCTRRTQNPGHRSAIITCKAIASRVLRPDARGFTNDLVTSTTWHAMAVERALG